MSTQRAGRFAPPPHQEDVMSDQWMDYEGFEEGGTAITTDLTQNDRAVHLDFFNDFDDIFNDEDLD